MCWGLSRAAPREPRTMQTPHQAVLLTSRLLWEELHLHLI